MFRSGAKSQHDDELLCDPNHIFTGRKQKAKAKQRVHRSERRKTKAPLHFRGFLGQPIWRCDDWFNPDCPD